MAIRQICQYKYTNKIYINQILVRWSSTSWHKVFKTNNESCPSFFCAYMFERAHISPKKKTKPRAIRLKNHTKGLEL